jgi:HAD superfamily hydrolase (TIGR01509 family)
MKKAWADWLHYFQLSLKDYGLTLSKKEFSKACNQFFGQDEPVLSEPNLTVFEKRIKSLCSSLQIKISDEAIGQVADLVVSKWREEIKLDQEAIPVLKKLKKTKILGLVTNYDHPRHVRKYLKHYKLDAFFDTVVISGDEGVKKPDPIIFKPLLSKAGLKPSEVAYVGDSQEDMEAANVAGMMSIWINRPDTDHFGKTQDFEHHLKNESMQINNKIQGQWKTILNLRELLSLV